MNLRRGIRRIVFVAWAVPACVGIGVTIGEVWTGFDPSSCYVWECPDRSKVRVITSDCWKEPCGPEALASAEASFRQDRLETIRSAGLVFSAWTAFVWLTYLGASWVVAGFRAPPG